MKSLFCDDDVYIDTWMLLKDGMMHMVMMG